MLHIRENMRPERAVRGAGWKGKKLENLRPFTTLSDSNALTAALLEEGLIQFN